MEAYPANPRPGAPKPEAPQKPEKAEKIITGKVIVKKAGPGQRLKAHLTGDDGKSVGHHIVHDVLLPSALDMFYEAGVELLGLVLGRSNRSRAGGVGQFNYSNIANSIMSKVNYQPPGFMASPTMATQKQQSRSTVIPVRSTIDLEDIQLETRVEADAILLQMDEYIGRFGQATRADLFDMLGITGESTDENFGWKNLHGVRPHRNRNGMYSLNLPRAIQLD